MSETIKEMVLPGTYIEVRSEGLIGVSGIATGNLGVVGTASRGPVGEVVLLGSYAEAVETFGLYDEWKTGANDHPLTLTRTLEQAFRGGASTVYAVRIGAAGSLRSAEWDLEDKGATAATILFSLRAASPGTWANDIEVKLTDGPAATQDDRTLELQLGQQKESFSGQNAGELFDAVNHATTGSALVRAVSTAPLTQAQRTAIVKLPTGGTVPRTTSGANGAGAGASEADTGLTLLASQPVHIVVVGGLSVADVSAEILGHLEATENDGRERIAVLGTAVEDPTAMASLPSNPRIVLVTPGILAADAARSGPDTRVALPPPYAAALVAGRLSTLAPHVSPTNKDVAVAGLSRIYTRAEQKDLLGKGILVLHQNLGFRILKGLSTATGAFTQITTRRIVDYAKTGVRIGANPYIGKLNNPRVRGALQATLDGFLSGMVLDEMLISYELAVTATRDQEINGVALVTMVLRPTFSIDFIKVIMNLA